MQSFRSIRAFRALESIPGAVVDLGMDRPRLVMLLTVVVTVALLAAIVLRVDVDTDPENMLPSDDPVRVLNRSIQSDFGTRDMIVLGIVNEGGVLTSETLEKTSRLIDEIKTLPGVIPEGVVSFKSAIDVPEGELSPEDVSRLASAVNQDPLLAGRVISPDGKGLAIYVPLESKDDANGVSSDIKGLLKSPGLEIKGEHHLAGLPLAEETFGRNMFIQMAFLGPIAGLLIFLLMLYFFRRLMLVIGAMLLAMLSVIWTMGLLIGTGFSLHIMSSMIPVFLMPIAILDSIHILSEFFDQYPKYQDRRATLRAVYKELFTPISFTTLTTAVAFGSLALAPIPPVQVFGLFIAIGVIIAWLLTMVFVPAFVIVLGEESLKRIATGNVTASERILAWGVRGMGRIATKRSYIVTGVFILLVAASIPGVTRITVNDNPVRWFKSGSEIRVAIRELNQHFPGTYNASLIIESDQPGMLTDPEVVAAVAALQDRWKSVDAVGQTTSYVDAVKGATPSGEIPEDQDEIERALELAVGLPSGSLVGSFITADHSRGNVQVLMKNGDNQAMQEVVDRTDDFLKDNPLPPGISTAWAGETFLNLVWQDKMVSGMLKAFITTFAVVLVLVILLFRSLRWGLVAMLPMSATVLFVYGALGFIGKDYDMPLAVLSTLVLGISIDFAIHFLQRYREQLKDTLMTSGRALSRVFEEPARAIARNALIVALGFVPMFFSTLVPYIVVGQLMVAIMILSFLASLLLLPAVITLFQRGEAKELEAETS